MDLEHLENQPQKSLKTVHSILTSSIRDLEQRLRDLQRSFYGTENGSMEELTKWSGVLRRVVDRTQVNGLYSVGQMEEILRVETTGRGAFPDDLPTIHRMMECCRKTENAVARGEVQEILVEIGRVLVLTNKYCASFYNPECDPFVETAAAYEHQRRRYINVVDELVEKTHGLATKFRSSAKGVRLVDLSANSADLLRKTGTAHAPFLLLFPEACENIRSALETLLSWINDDRKYVGFVDSDVREMDVRRTEVEKRVRGLRNAYHQLIFRRKQFREEAERRELKLDRLRIREDELIVDEEFVSVEIRDTEAELDSTELRWSELIRNGIDGGEGGGGGQPPEAGFYDRLNELTDKIQALKAKLPTSKQQLLSLRGKLKTVTDKQTRLRSEEKRGVQQEVEIDDVSSRLAESETESKGIAHALETARKIILCKRSSDVVEKIFYDQEVIRAGKSKTKGCNGERHMKTILSNLRLFLHFVVIIVIDVVVIITAIIIVVVVASSIFQKSLHFLLYHFNKY